MWGSHSHTHTYPSHQSQVPCSCEHLAVLQQSPIDVYVHTWCETFGTASNITQYYTQYYIIGRNDFVQQQYSTSSGSFAGPGAKLTISSGCLSPIVAAGSRECESDKWCTLDSRVHRRQWHKRPVLCWCYLLELCIGCSARARGDRIVEMSRRRRYNEATAHAQVVRQRRAQTWIAASTVQYTCSNGVSDTTTTQRTASRRGDYSNSIWSTLFDLGSSQERDPHKHTLGFSV